MYIVINIKNNIFLGKQRGEKVEDTLKLKSKRSEKEAWGRGGQGQENKKGTQENSGLSDLVSCSLSRESGKVKVTGSRRQRGEHQVTLGITQAPRKLELQWESWYI